MLGLLIHVEMLNLIVNNCKGWKGFFLVKKELYCNDLVEAMILMFCVLRSIYLHSTPVCVHEEHRRTFEAIKAIKSLIAQVFVVVTFYAKDPFFPSYRFRSFISFQLQYVFIFFNGDFHLFALHCIWTGWEKSGYDFALLKRVRRMMAELN